jgi:hypothetical protein
VSNQLVSGYCGYGDGVGNVAIKPRLRGPLRPSASKSNLSVEEDTKMAKGHAVCRNLKGEGVMTVVRIEN